MRADLDTFIIGIPAYEGNVNIHLLEALLKLGIKEDRIITQQSTNIARARNMIATAFVQQKRKANVLLMLDADVVINDEQIKLLVLNCHHHVPVLGSNMLYSGNEPTSTNWFLHNDENLFKKLSMLNEASKAGSIVAVKHLGLGATAIHRSVLEDLVNENHVDYCEYSYYDFFGYTKKRKLIDCWESIEAQYKTNLKLDDIDEPLWDKIWESHRNAFKAWHEQYALAQDCQILPESYSFCERVNALGRNVGVMLGVRPGHKQGKEIIFAELPGKEQKIKHNILNPEEYKDAVQQRFKQSKKAILEK